jgi:predicted phosphodiesterase
VRILLFSDIHTEFWKEQFGQSGKPEAFPLLPDPDTYDIVVAAGDIGMGLKGFDWLEKNFPSKTVLYVPGNHEYYRNDYFALQERYNSLNRLNNSNVVILNPGALTIDGVRFIGATLWSDLKLKGYNDFPDFVFENGIADFNVISAGSYGPKMDATLMREIYKNELKFIEDELDNISAEQMKRTVLITHFVPSQLLIDPKWLQPQFLRLNPYFTNDLDYALFDRGFPLAIYGHTHDRNDMEHPTGVRCVGNPFGYPNENRDPYEWKIVEI